MTCIRCIGLKNKGLSPVCPACDLQSITRENLIKKLEAELVALKASMPREEVMSFAREMERVLKNNDYKGGWKNCDLGYLSRRLTQEYQEFIRAFARYKADKDHEQSKLDILDEACDVANILMFIMDTRGALHSPPDTEQGEEQ